MKREWSDEELARALGAVSAEPSDAPLARALARLRAEQLPAWCAWTTRPWALFAACALLVVSLAGGTWLGATGRLGSATSTVATNVTSGATDSDPLGALLGEDANGASSAVSAAEDSGAMR